MRDDNYKTVVVSETVDPRRYLPSSIVTHVVAGELTAVTHGVTTPHQVGAVLGHLK